MATIRETISRQVRTYRKAQGFTQARLAESAQISEESVVAIERQKSTASLETLQQISTVLNVNLTDLLSGGDGPVSKLNQELEGLCPALKARNADDVQLVRRIAEAIFSRFDKE